jgi:leucyl-tRNA synthetase
VRDEISAEVGESKENIIEKGKKTEKIRRWLEGKKIIKEIYVPGKMVNLVVVE